jgi:hypothetical protein
MRIRGTVREIGAKAFSFHGRLIDLSFEEGTMRICAFAFSSCRKLKNSAFPTSLIGIGENAFEDCWSLYHITFGVGSQLQYIRGKAFSKCHLKRFVVPASIMGIDPSAFSDKV